MQDAIIFKRGNIEITTKIARFGGTTYQVCNIGSVATFFEKKFNVIAIALFVIAILVGLWANDMNTKHYGDPQLPVAIAVTAAVLAIIIQMFWPRKVFTFLLKTSSNDVYKLVSEDGEWLESIQGALESAFLNS